MILTGAVPQQSSSAEEILRWAVEQFGPRVALTTSFQREGMVVLDMLARAGATVPVLTLDTGRLPEETYSMIETVRSRYGIQVRCIQPDGEELERMLDAHGPNLFHESVAKRRLCCEIRKVRPIERALAGYDAYLTGIRRGQSATRESASTIESDGGRTKINPLIDWTREQVQEYTREHDVPVHPLYSKGYTSIGCGPCTRATLEGEDERAGRWWWEQSANKECGLHFSPDGRAEPLVNVLLREVLEPGRA